MGVFEVINELERNREEWNVARETIEFIFVILKITKPKNVLEIGTFNGYSALWLSLNSKNVVTLEVDKERVRTAKDNFLKANVKNIKIIGGDAIENLKKLKERFDIIFIDGKKSEYKEYLESSLKLLNENGLIFVDNTISHKYKLKEFFEYLKKSKLYYQELNLGKGLIIISK